MQKTRREILLFMGGGAAGAMLTPAPWRLITDTAIWSENWPGIPRPAAGEVSERYTNCALCPAGCAVRARLVNGQPVSLAGAAGHPWSRGAMCAFGLTAHHLPYHPDRLKVGSASEAETAAAVADAMARRGAGEKAAVLDLAPGRAASAVYRRAMAAVKDGVYLTPERPLGGARVDLSKARTVLSLGVPLFAGWGTPGNLYTARANFRLIQAEPYESATAALSDEWLAIKPGSEAILAAALAGKIPNTDAAVATGLAEQRIVDVGLSLRANGPSVVLAPENSPEVFELNRALGAFGKTLVADDSAEHGAPDGATLASVPDGSIRVLFLDESVPGAHIPWKAIERKLVPSNPLVVAFAWSREGYGRHAHFVLPAAVYPEMLTDIPSALDSPAPMFRLAAPLVAAPAGMIDPVAFVAKTAGIDPGNPLREKADAIQKAGRGSVFTPAGGKSTPVRSLKPDDFWKALNNGATWMGEPAAGTSFAKPASTLAAGDASDFRLAVAFTGAHFATLASPLMAKLYQDSDLRLAPDTVALHPDTARAAGLADAARGKLETAYGACAVGLVLDAAVPKGLLRVAPGPETLDICGANTRAKVAAL
ncbi:MAG TPA: hypothetical protein VMU19_15485 [Bryobacteraceae bacterium]|nr:hypothetical protein [Bryobacteraceae bacterium]